MNRLIGINTAILGTTLSFWLAGCGETNPNPNNNGGSGGADGGPRYAISTIIFSPDLSMRQEFVKFSDGLMPESKIDESSSIEFPAANPTLWSSMKSGEFFIADSSNGDINKYGFDADDKIIKTQGLSLMAYGIVKTNWPLMIVHSDTQAFFFDEITQSAIVFNPQDMTITSNVDLKSSFTPTEGGTTYTVWRERAPIKVGNKYFATYKYFNLQTLETLYARSGMLVIDADTGTFSTFETPACGGLFHSVLGKDGLIYGASGVVAAAGHFNQQPNSASACMVRFDPAAMKWDETYLVDLASVVGPGKFVGGIFAPDQKEGTVYTRVLMEANAPTGKTALQLTAAPVWETYRLDHLAMPTAATKVDVLRPAGGVPYPFYVDGKSYTTGVNLSATPNQSWIVDFTQDPLTEQLEMPGWGYFAIRVR
jgi:hypothetical protein